MNKLNCVFLFAALLLVCSSASAPGVLGAACGCEDCDECSGPFPGQQCMEYSCSDYVCKRAKILNCCPNEICEAGEDYGNCPGDCVPKELSIEVLSPTSEQSFMRGESVLLKFKILADDRPIASADTNVIGVFGIIDLKNDGEHGDGLLGDSVYGNYAVVGEDVDEGTYDLVVSSSFLGLSKIETFEVEIVPRLDMSVEVDQSVVLGETVHISGVVKKKGEYVSIPLEVSITQNDEEIFKEDVESNEAGEFEVEYHTATINPDGVWQVRVYGEDATGNYALFEDMILVAEAKSVQPLDVEFLSRINPNYTRGENLLVVAKVIEGGENISRANCMLHLPNGDKVDLKELQQGQYSAMYEIPLDAELEKQNFFISASYVDGNVLHKGEKVFVTNILPAELTINVIKPEQMSFMVGEKIEFITEVTYPNESLVPNADVKILVFDEEIALEQIKKGLYVTEYVTKDSKMGETDVYFGATDEYGNEGFKAVRVDISGKSGTYYVKQYGTLGIIAVVVIGAVGAIVGVARWRKAKLKHLQEKEEGIKEKIMDLQNRYFSEKSVGVKAYKELLGKYENELAVVQQSIEFERDKKGNK